MAQKTQSAVADNGTQPAEIDITGIQEALDMLNERSLAAGISQFKFGIARPRDFIPAPLNAHFMRDETFRQLVANIREDGNLSSHPICFHEDDKVFTIDGHHRVEAAKKAGVPWMYYIYLDRGVDDDERIARQLAANAIVGQDDEQKLLTLYSKLDIRKKMYTGLDEKRFKMYEPINLKAFADKALTLKQIELMFMPNEVQTIIDKLDAIGKSSRARLIGTLDQHQPMIQAFMGLKKATNVHNSSVAFMVMLECTTLYCEWLANVQEMSSADWLSLHEELARRGLAETMIEGENGTGHTDETNADEHDAEAQ